MVATFGESLKRFSRGLLKIASCLASTLEKENDIFLAKRSRVEVCYINPLCCQLHSTCALHKENLIHNYLSYSCMSGESYIASQTWRHNRRRCNTTREQNQVLNVLKYTNIQTTWAFIKKVFLPIATYVYSKF